LPSHESTCCLTSQFFGQWRQRPLTSACNISGDPIKGYLSQTKVSMTEHQTSRSFLKVWPWASGALMDTPAGGNPLLRTSQKQTSMCHVSCLFLFLSSWGTFLSQYQTNSS
jgi:hypothetical protein